MSEANPNIIWHKTKLTQAQRDKNLGQSGVIVWFTGLSGSGKSTLASEVEAMLVKRGIHTFVLDGDNIRHGLNSDLSFSDLDRKENIRRISHVAKLFCDANVITLTAFISPFRADRELARKLVKEGHFIEVYCDASLNDCEKRDPKGLYSKARRGEIADFTGISSPYEAPLKPEIVLKTGQDSVKDCTITVVNYLDKKGFI
ncbi:MAG: hypothetical protein ACD_73C00019G0002 [uncultured bacterium]|nr:MAG: hypothetical protein ACD_73C00019G0002 [uncultured bacterium]